MKRLFCYIVLFSTILSACTADLEEQRVSTDGASVAEKIINGSEGCVRGGIIVKFNTSAESRLAECATRSGATRTGVPSVDAVLDRVDGCGVEQVFIVTEKNREKVYADGLHLWYELQFDAESDVDAVAADLASIDEIQAVQFIHKAYLIGAPKAVAETPLLFQSKGVTRASNKIPFDDSYSHYQWSFHNLGSKSEVKKNGNIKGLADPIVGADINILPAWRLCTGDSSIVVAIVDEGVDNTHEDLMSNLWINNTELNGVAGVDDDGNGYKDDVYGFNFATMNGAITWDKKNDSGHGSHVAGIVSAVNNNDIGVCGIAGGSGKNDGVKLMSIQIFSGNGGATSTNLSRAMQYAADNGAHILQCSWGYLSAKAAEGGYGNPGNDTYYKRICSTEAAAIDYFVKNGGTKDGPIDGGLAIFAAGNSNAPLPAYPAAYEPCVAVAALSPSLRPTYYTDYGVGTDICAPGGESLYDYGSILSTVPTKFAQGGTSCYAMMQGTSQACPHVSGVAALGLSYAKRLGKRYSAKEFRSMLLSATHNLDPFLTGEISFKDAYGQSYNIKYPDYKGKMGLGYVDAYKLLLQIDGTPHKVIEVGKEQEIDLALYFGEGVANAQFVKAEASAEDIANIGLTIGEYANGKLTVSSSKSGAATITVKMLVGGGSLSDNTQPYPTEVSKSFVLISKNTTSSNGGWL